MKFALFNGEKLEATKGAKGTCPSCGSELIAKCGEKNVNHWAHKGNRNCDLWWENETDWHRSWKNQFPKDWQEVIHRDNGGEKHIADVKTREGYVLEFQYSFLKPDERRSRNAFYSNLVWVVNGGRRSTDKNQFDKALKANVTLPSEIPIYELRYFFEECRILNEWQNSDVPVFFDFQDTDDLDELMLWLLIPQITTRIAYIVKIPRAIFIELHKENRFEETYNRIIRGINNLIGKDMLKEVVKSSDILPEANAQSNPVIHPNAFFQLNRKMIYGRRRRWRL